ncbi:MAG: DUF2333 family protein [Halopseudomonas sp.]|uniref:DUF2333 family protein n=1 Tax=Halopseudomonas sp. TaxID=2901191 RepID=UPI00300187A4
MKFGTRTDSNLAAPLGKIVLVVLVVYLLICLILGWYWSREPALKPLISSPQGGQMVPGEYTARTLDSLMVELLNKPGGYISNDIAPPGLWLDNMPSWEFGVLVQVRDMSRALRRDMARSQSQSTEDPDLAKAEPLFSVDNNSWAMPSSEGEYRQGLQSLNRYIIRLNQGDAQFYARADNLASWVSDVSTRLGSLSQRLSASVGRAPLIEGGKLGATTPWLEIDDVFYEARGTSWALVHLLRAVERDFHDVLLKKNALVSLQQIIRDLEATQETLWSPMVLNGGGFGMMANHSLVMANYLSRANAAMIDLRRLLEQG